MPRSPWLTLALALVPGAAHAGESCITDITVMGMTTRTCTANVGMPDAAFREFCETGKKNPPPGISFQVTYAAKCPAGWAGSCAVKPPAGAIVNHWYDRREAAAARKVCTESSPLGPGTWTDG